MRRHEDDGVDAADPKVSLFVSLNKPRLQLSRFQCHTLLNKEDAWGLAEPWAPDVLRPLWPTPPIRPVRGPSSDTACFTRIWWQYALNVVLHSVSAKRRQKRKLVRWKYFGSLVLLRKKYIEAYKKKLRSLAGEDERQVLAQAEAELMPNDVTYFRRLARHEHAAEEQKLELAVQQWKDILKLDKGPSKKKAMLFSAAKRFKEKRCALVLGSWGNTMRARG